MEKYFSESLGHHEVYKFIKAQHLIAVNIMLLYHDLAVLLRDILPQLLKYDLKVLRVYPFIVILVKYFEYFY